MREATSWLTNHPDFAEALVKWREGVAGVEPDRHRQVNSGLASVLYLVESFLKVIRRDLQSNEELSDVAAFSSHLAAHEDCLAEGAFVDEMRGGVLNPESHSSETRGSRVVLWHGRLGANAVPCVGSPPTRVTRVDHTTGLDWS